MWTRKEGTDAYMQWKEGHVCKINHIKSSGAMEAGGTVAIFHRSIEKYKLRYTNFIGDGDSGSFLKVCEIAREVRMCGACSEMPWNMT